jgi:hypothetical protein
MARSNQCDGCSQADGCHEARRQLGCQEGPSVTCAVLVAFLLPIVVFAVSLGGWGWWLEGRVAGPYRTPVALFLAVLVTTALLLAGRAASRRWARK